MSALAIDIGSYTIKAISGKPGKNVRVDRVTEVFNTNNIVVPGEDSQIEKLAEQLDNLIKSQKLPVTDVRLSLPESVVSTKVISVPSLTDAELSSAIGWQAEQYIPIPPEELSLEYKVLFRPDKKDKQAQMRVLLVGIRRSVVERFINVFDLLGVEPRFLETQILSVIRSLQFEPGDANTLVVHMGAAAMTMAMVAGGELAFVFNHNSGGQMLTRSLEQSLGLDLAQAEQYKRAYGLDQSQFQGKVFQALNGPVKVLTDEMQKAIRFYTNSNPTETVNRVLLSGGGAQMPGLIETVTKNLGVEVLLASPFSGANGAIPDTNHPALTVCMGLLMR